MSKHVPTAEEMASDTSARDPESHHKNLLVLHKESITDFLASQDQFKASLQKVYHYYKCVTIEIFDFLYALC